MRALLAICALSLLTTIRAGADAHASGNESGHGVQTIAKPGDDQPPFPSAVPGGWMNSAGDWTPNVAAFWKAIDERCPQRRWRHATMGSYEAPLEESSKSLDDGQRLTMERETSIRCRDMNGDGCLNVVAIDVVVRAGHLPELVHAFCAVQPQTFE